jgi:transposase-like protein
VLTEIKNRGVADVCIVVCDGLSGLPDAVTATWPQAIVQLCVVHYADVRIMPMWAVKSGREADFLLSRSA